MKFKEWDLYTTDGLALCVHQRVNFVDHLDALSIHVCIVTLTVRDSRLLYIPTISPSSAIYHGCPNAVAPIRTRSTLEGFPPGFQMAGRSSYTKVISEEDTQKTARMPSCGMCIHSVSFGFLTDRPCSSPQSTRAAHTSHPTPAHHHQHDIYISSPTASPTANADQQR
jgi:hypothetical protein